MPDWAVIALCWGRQPGRCPDPLAKVTQRQVQPGQVTASPPPLRRAFAGGWPAGDVPGQAVPQPVVAHRVADRVRDSPSGAGQVTKHRVLIPQILGAGSWAVAPEHGTLPARQLDQPAAVARRDILQHSDPARPHAQHVKHAANSAGQHRGHPSRASPLPPRPARHKPAGVPVGMRQFHHQDYGPGPD